MAARQGVNVHLGEEFKRVANSLREVDRALPGKLRKDLEKAVRPAVADAKAHVRAVPVQGQKHTGLRRRIARGVKIQARTSRSPVLRVLSTMTDPQEQGLPGYLDDPAKGWRHPVFGNRDKWVSQHTGAPWFRDVMADHRPEMEHNLQRVLDDAAETIAAAGRG
ncbi:hypothetical protein DEJ49_33565 [Streptomyces venezuelae]|uniref:HK97 gp10 family phage protein n=1 Tax=Streptomyces venezuelae TaxID=54571 RepID=A0A5P2CWL9_STRVZ|nr:hypothetical protein [Streptomyces venezuelae]QES45269.1 hypothetical protein DEJ49_33565 [Streptomyces venezuelae]